MAAGSAVEPSRASACHLGSRSPWMVHVRGALLEEDDDVGVGQAERVRLGSPAASSITRNSPTASSFMAERLLLADAAGGRLLIHRRGLPPPPPPPPPPPSLHPTPQAQRSTCNGLPCQAPKMRSGLIQRVKLRYVARLAPAE